MSFEKSKAAPGVFGVFAEPKEANAPLPKPKAEEAPADGDFVADGDRAENGLDLFCEEESPYRLDV